MIRPILLDTCAAIWVSQGDAISGAADHALAEADAGECRLAVSPITAWEIGMLVARGRLALTREPAAWFDALIGAGVELAPMGTDVLIASSFLPGLALRDPADRILAATARLMDFRLMTRDDQLLSLGAAGHLSVISC